MQINRPYKFIRPDDVFVKIHDDDAQHAANREYLIDFRQTDIELLNCFFKIIQKYCKPNCKQIAQQMQLREDTLRHTIFALTGTNMHEWICSYVFLNSCEFLTRTNLPITKIAKRLGFSSCSNFTQFFMRMQKFPPVEYRQNYRQ